MQVTSTQDSAVKSLGIDKLPAIVGWMLNGEKVMVKTGPIKDLKSGMKELKTLMDSFEKKNKNIPEGQWRRSSAEAEGSIPELTTSNIEAICGKKTALCIIGVYRTRGAKKRVESVLSNVSFLLSISCFFTLLHQFLKVDSKVEASSCLILF